MRGMVINMNDEQLHTLADLQAFLTGTVAIDFTVTADQRYEFIARIVRRFGYARLKRADKAVVLRFLERVSGYSRQQLTRLVKRGCERRELVKRYQGSRTSFARIYTGADVLLLAHTDTLHGTLSGLATKKLMERAYGIFGDARYQRLAAISVAHLYTPRLRGGRLCGAAPAISISVRSGPRLDLRRFLSASVVRQPPTTGPDICVWTVFIRAIWMASKASITSMPWTASPSTKALRPARRSVRHSSFPCSKRCY